MGKRFYAVYRGHNVGIFTDLTYVMSQIRGFSNPNMRRFNTEIEAKEYLSTLQAADQTLQNLGNDIQNSTKNEKSRSENRTRITQRCKFWKCD